MAIAGLLLCLLGRRRLGLVLASLAVVLLWISATPLVARTLLAGLESRHPPLAMADIPSADVAIVLGGALEGAVPPRRRPDLGEASDRILHAYELFKAGKVRAILVSGGNLPWLAEAVPEAEAIRSLLVSWGIPDSAVITGGRSRTTAENAKEVAAMWPSLDFSSSLLVTSAAHMPRALDTFRKAGINATPAATDVRAVAEPIDALDLLPDDEALRDTTFAIKETVGYLVYWMRGDI